MNQKVRSNWEEREKLRNKGQFWTPRWVAEAMVSYVVTDAQLVFDPAAGRGAFYKALKSVDATDGKIKFYGTDIDETVFEDEIYQDNESILELRDFVLSPPNKKFKAIVANPPYIRHHRLSNNRKKKLKEISLKILGFTIDGRAGLHIYFLIQALNLLEPDGKLAFIMPADTCEGIFAKKLWKWIANNYCIEATVTFLPKATPFPNVDTNAVVFLIKNSDPESSLWWIQSKEPHSDDLKDFINSDFKAKEYKTLNIVNRLSKEAINTGLSRPPIENTCKYKLSHFASVMRGIATGANEFFFLTENQATFLKIPAEFLKTAIGRTRDVQGSIITKETIIELEKKERPTLLFSPNDRKYEAFPKEMQNYLRKGEKQGINKKALIKTRNPWYKMEQRKVPAFLFAYLGRRNVRFIKNEAKVLPLTGFLCVYPNSTDKDYVEGLWDLLNHSNTLNNLTLVAKSYGSGAIKVEPRALENLPIPDELVELFDMVPITKNNFKQASLFPID